MKKSPEQIHVELNKRIIALRYWLLGRNYLNSANALEYVKEIHTGFRKDNITPELDHLVRVANHVKTFEKSLMYPDSTIAAALLHDTVEDYDIPKVVLNLKFDRLITDAVLTLSKVIDGEKKNNKAYYDDIANCEIASVVKGCDRCHNFSTMHGVFTKEKQIDYVKEGEDFTVPMLKSARRLFPSQEPIYENIKLMLRSQIELINIINGE